MVEECKAENSGGCLTGFFVCQVLTHQLPLNTFCSNLWRPSLPRQFPHGWLFPCLFCWLCLKYLVIQCWKVS